MKNINPFCTSSYLALRYVARDNEEWIPGVKPRFPHNVLSTQTPVKPNIEDIELSLRRAIDAQLTGKPALFLSGGIDSAILAALLPKQTKVYHIKFIAEGAVDESVMARKYAEENGLEFHLVEVTWDDYAKFMPLLMKNKKAPLHAIEPGLYKAAQMALSDGCTEIFVGNGADSTFGGLDKLLSRDWTYDEFYKRYTFVDPSLVLEKAVDIQSAIYSPYRLESDQIDYVKFLKEIHGLGVVQTFEAAIEPTGLPIRLPYETLKMSVPLDFERIRSGQPKYLLFELFHKLYPTLDAPTKIPFARPVDVWLKDYNGPEHPVFKPTLDMDDFTGEQKFLMFCLDIFLFILEDGQL